MSIKYLCLTLYAIAVSASEVTKFLYGAEPISYAEESKSNGTVIKCFWFNSDFYSAFDLSKLKPNLAGVYSNFTLDPENKKTIIFDFCDNISGDYKCEKDTQVVYSDSDSEKKCTKRLSEKASNGSQWSLLDSQNQTNGILIKMFPGDDPDKIVTFKIKCNENISDFVFLSDESSHSIEGNNLTFTIVSKHGCPQLDLYFVYKTIMDRFYIFGSALILLGLFELFLGHKLVTATIFIFSAAVVVIFVFVLFFQYIIPGGVHESIVWFVLAIAIILGLVLGYFVAKYKDKVFGIIMGSLLGYIVGQIVYNLVLNHIDFNQKALQIITYVVCIAICIALGICLFNIVTIFSTALIGAYAVIRGISIFVGGFPNETTIADLVSREETEQLKQLLNWKVYCYLAGWLVLFVVGLVVQIKIFAADKDEEKKKNENKGGDEETSEYYKKFGYKK